MSDLGGAPPKGGKKGAPVQRGRLIFCEHGGVARRGYRLEAREGARGVAGWAAVVHCRLGDHFLAPDPEDASRVVERTATRPDLPVDVHLWARSVDAQAAIDQLARQQEELEEGAR